MNKPLLKQKAKEKTGRRDLNVLLAETCHVSLPTAHNWLTGKTKMPIDAVKDVQKAFDFSDAEIIEIFVRA